MSLLTYLFGKGFTGGPDFRLNRTRHFNLNGVSLELTVPDTNMVLAPSQLQDNYPFNENGWFDKNSERLANHIYVSIPASGAWAYVGPYWKVMREPFGILHLSTWIKRTLPGYRLKTYDLEALKKAIVWDYSEHFEAAEEGKYGRGRNTKVRQEAIEMYGDSARYSDEMKRRLHLYIEKRSRELPKEFEIREYGTQRWLYYELQSEPSYPVHHYCQPLDDQYYIDVQFYYRIDFRQYFNLWKNDAFDAEQKMIETVRLNFPDRVMDDDGFIPKVR